jgi:hypothetical protein
MKIFIDFDDTLFCTKDFKKDLIGLFFRQGITKKAFDASYQIVIGDATSCKVCYNPKKQIALLQKNYSFDGKKLEKELALFLKDLRRYVFTDSLAFLGNFKKKELFLVTYGNIEMQTAKLHGAGLEKYFSKLIIAEKSKATGISKFIRQKKASTEKMYFLDDRTEYIFEVKKKFPEIITFLMQRSAGRYTDKADKYCDFTAKNLGQVLKIIQKLEKNNLIN